MASHCPSFNPVLVTSHKFPETIYTYSERDAVIYALGVGACQRDPVDEDELKYVYHRNGQQFVQVLPAFATVYSFRSLPIGHLVPGLEYDPRLVLYGQHYIELYKPLPSCGRVRLLSDHSSS